jgi:LTXXQ motif family protein
MMLHSISLLRLYGQYLRGAIHKFYDVDWRQCANARFLTKVSQILFLVRRKDMKKTAMVLIAGAMFAGAATLAVAQSDSQRGRGWGMGRMMMDGSMMGRGYMGGYGPMMGFDSEGMLDRIDGRLAFIKAELKIRDDQLAEWDALAQVIRENAEVHNDMMHSMMEDMHDGKYFEKPLPERLTIMETHMEARLEQTRAVREALDKLYAVLDDDQKKTADEVVLPVTGMDMGMMMR